MLYTSSACGAVSISCRDNGDSHPPTRIIIAHSHIILYICIHKSIYITYIIIGIVRRVYIAEHATVDIPSHRNSTQIGHRHRFASRKTHISPLHLLHIAFFTRSYPRADPRAIRQMLKSIEIPIGPVK